MGSTCSTGLMPDRFMLLESQEIRAMPFQETGAMAERIALVKDYDTGVFSISELARRYGVARETVYIWTRRRERGPMAQAEIAPRDLAPNVEWAVDFKGHFRTRDGRRCDPLIGDRHGQPLLNRDPDRCPDLQWCAELFRAHLRCLRAS
jgi:hypothetical protein